MQNYLKNCSVWQILDKKSFSHIAHLIKFQELTEEKT